MRRNCDRRRPIELSISAQRRSARQFDGRLAVFALPPELSNGDAEGGYRLICSDGREVPYVVTSDAGESKDRRQWPACRYAARRRSTL
ncbi:MAG: hypothetical protein U0787_23285 [Polyangia bacterium]